MDGRNGEVVTMYRRPGPADRDDRAAALAVDAGSRRLLVAGSTNQSGGGDGDSDYLTLSFALPRA